MKKNIFIGIILLIGIWYISIPFVGTNRYMKADTESPQEQAQVTKDMKLTSPAFLNEENIPVEYTCDGNRMSPPLAIAGVPEGTRSLAVIVDDPDAPSGTFTHWIIWNIDPATPAIPAGAVPQKAQEGTNSSGRIGYVPPCPTGGSHRYFFTLFALDSVIGLDGKAKKAELESAMSGHIMLQTNLIGTYGR